MCFVWREGGWHKIDHKNVSKGPIFHQKSLQWFKHLISFVTKKRLNREKKTVYLDLKSKHGYSRYLVNLICFFAMNQYNVIIRFRVKQILTYGHPESLMAELENVFMTLRDRKNATIRISDDVNNAVDIQLTRENYHRRLIEANLFHFPYSMHPLVYLEGHHKEKPDINRSGGGNQTFRLAFAGNLRKDFYNDIHLRGETFINRLHLITLLKIHFSSELFMPKTSEEYKEGSDKPICIIDRKNFSLPIRDYFRMQQHSDFMLCPPGMQRPLCHNLIESMYNRSIPLLQYNHYLKPPLENLKNSIVYKSEQEYLEKIEYKLRFSDEFIDDMKRNVEAYYDRFLAPEAVIVNFEKAVESGVRTITIPPTDHVFATFLSKY